MVRPIGAGPLSLTYLLHIYVKKHCILRVPDGGTRLFTLDRRIVWMVHNIRYMYVVNRATSDGVFEPLRNWLTFLYFSLNNTNKLIVLIQAVILTKSFRITNESQW